MTIKNTPLFRTQEELDQGMLATGTYFELLGDVTKPFKLVVPAGVFKRVYLHGGCVHVTGEGSLVISGFGLVRVTGLASLTARGNLEVHVTSNGEVKILDSCDARVSGTTAAVVLGQCRVAAFDTATLRVKGEVFVTANDCSRVIAFGTAHVICRDSSVADVSDQVVAWAHGNSSVYASGDATVTAYCGARVRATGRVVVRDFAASYDMLTTSSCTVLSTQPNKGLDGVPGTILPLSSHYPTVQSWCERHGVSIDSNDSVVLYKAVNSVFYSSHGMRYVPGTWSIAEDWNGTKTECGGGLHFTPRPSLSLEYHGLDRLDVRFVACYIRLSDIAHFRRPNFETKIKAAMCFNLYECDLFGTQIGESFSPDSPPALTTVIL